MDPAGLRRKAVKEGVPAAIIEKDYALSVALKQLSKTRLRSKLMFKGGTAIKKVYFRDARFSEDLDFTVKGMEPRGIADELKTALENKDMEGIRFGVFEHEKTSAGLRLALKFTVFLEQPQRIRFDFSFRENAVLPPIERAIFDDYSLGETNILVLTPEELLAEKIQAVFSRTAARDLYDLWFLLKHGVKPDESLIQKKFAYYDETYVPVELKDRLDGFRPKWKQGLDQYLREVPAFEAISKELLKMLQLG